MSDLITAPIATTREIAGNNRAASYFVTAALIVAYATGNLPLPSIPSYWPAVLVAIGGAALAGRSAAKRIQELIPDPDGIILVEFDASESGGGAIYEISEDAFENMRVLGGDLFQWDSSPRRVYEVRDYNVEHNVALANWRESVPGSALAGQATVDDVFAAIRELREDLEPDVAKARETRRRMRGVIRTLDKDRAEAQQAILDDHVAPDLGSSRTISEVIDEEIPDDLHPGDAPDPNVDMTGDKTNGDTPDEESEDVQEITAGPPLDFSEVVEQ